MVFGRAPSVDTQHFFCKVIAAIQLWKVGVDSQSYTLAIINLAVKSILWRKIWRCLSSSEVGRRPCIHCLGQRVSGEPKRSLTNKTIWDQYPIMTGKDHNKWKKVAMSCGIVGGAGRSPFCVFSEWKFWCAFWELETQILEQKPLFYCCLHLLSL